VTNCAKCGAFVSRYATIGDRFCWPCHPRIEARYVRVCANGHDLSLHGEATASGAGRTTTRCMTCKRENDRITAAYRRAARKQGEA
jgi:predicted SnoaL-like aldol condensation-catalyzing enzyme